MTVSANYAPLEYAGNGVTVNFPVTWPFDAAASLLVTEVDDATGASVLKALTTHYLVTQTRTGGTVTALTPPVTGTTWRIARSTPKTQPNQLRLSGAFNPEVVEAMIDRPVMQIQELGGEVDRAIKLPADSVGVATELPTPTPLNLIGWNAASNGLENFSPDAFVAATTAGVAHQYPVTAGQATLDVQNIVSPFGVGQLFYNGIFQNPAAYSVSSGVLTFTEALPVDGVVTIIAVFRSADQITDSDQLFYTPAAVGAATRSIRGKLGDTVSLKDFGFSVTASAADNDAAWAGAYAEIVARGGGVIHIPGDSSVYNAVGPWTITQDGVTLVGTGRQNARIDFSAGVGDGIVFTDVDYFGIENVNVRNAAGSGVVVQGSTTGVYATRGYINKCVSLANGADGFLLDNVFLVELDGLQGNQNGGYGLQFLGFHTTVQARNCQGYANVLGGWKINDMMYSSFDSCAADLNNGHGWVLQNLNGVSFRNCGAENNGLSGWLAQASAAIAVGAIAPDLYGVLLDGCFAINNNTASTSTEANFLRVEGAAADANPTNIEVANCRDKTPGSSPSVRVKGNAKVLDRQNNFVAAFTSETFSVRKRYPSNEQNPFGKSITGANTPLLTITDLVGNTTHYSALLMVTARSTKWPDNLGQSASYVLHVCKGATGSAANVINSAGATAGAASNHPSFTWALNTASNQLEVTPVGSTSGAFVFNVVPVGDAIIQFA